MSALWNIRNSYAAINARWLEVAAENGWRPSNGAIYCPIVVLGPSCRGSNWGGRRPCVCAEQANRLPDRNIRDHARRWIDADGRRVVTYETYSAPEDIATFQALCAERGISVEIAPRSPWNPGETTLLVFRAAR